MVSVIIPIFKVEQYIADCIRSVISQQNVNFEVILIDDCSPDDSAKIACDLLDASNVDYQYVHHDINMGLSAARNRGIRVAKGEYLFFLDSDDELIGENALFLLVEAAEQSKADCVAGNYVYAYSSSQCIPARYRRKCYFENFESIRAFSDTEVPVIACNKLLKKSFIVENSLYFCEGVINEDQLWSFAMALRRASMCLTGENTYLYKVRKGSIMRRDSLVKIKDACRIYDLMVSFYLTNAPYSKDDNRALTRYLDYFSWNLYKTLSHIKSAKSEQFGMYEKIRQIQHRYSGFGMIRYLRSVHIFLPKNMGGIICLTIMKLLAKLKQI